MNLVVMYTDCGNGNSCHLTNICGYRPPIITVIFPRNADKICSALVNIIIASVVLPACSSVWACPTLVSADCTMPVRF